MKTAELNNPEKKRYAVIDMGTNTFHLLIAEPNAGGFTVLHKEKVGVKLGKGSINQGYLSESAIARGLDCLKGFAQVASEFGIPAEEIIATATSAVRSAHNGKAFVQEVLAQTHINVQVIGGALEAQLIFEGVMAAVGKQTAPVLVMDIGGGSVEFVIANGPTILYKESYEIGGQRLMDLFMDTDPISEEAIGKIEIYLESKLAPLLKAAEQYSPKVLIGSSGTFDTLCEVYWQTNKLNYRLEELTQFDLPLSGYAEIAHKLVAMNKEQRLEVPGMIPLRADMIVVAICLINFVISKIATSQLIVSTYALKEGVLLASIAGKELQ